MRKVYLNFIALLLSPFMMSACSKNNECDINDLLSLDYSNYNLTNVENYFCIADRTPKAFTTQLIKTDIDTSKEIVVPNSGERTIKKYWLDFDIATGAIIPHIYVNDVLSNELDIILEENDFKKITKDDDKYISYVTDLHIQVVNDQRYYVDILGHLSYKKDELWYRSTKSIDIYKLYLDGLTIKYDNNFVRGSTQIAFSNESTFTFNGVTKTLEEIDSSLEEVAINNVTSTWDVGNFALTKHLFAEKNTEGLLEINNGDIVYYVDSNGTIFTNSQSSNVTGMAKTYFLVTKGYTEVTLDDPDVFKKIIALF